MRRLADGIWQMEYGRLQLVDSYWQLVAASARSVWVDCVQRVGVVSKSYGQTPVHFHSHLVTAQARRINSRFLHGLYYFFTQRFPMYFPVLLPLLIHRSSTLSTRPTMTTTTYINKSNGRMK